MPTTKQMSKVQDEITGIAGWALDTDESAVLGFATFQDEDSGKTKQTFAVDFPSKAHYRTENWDEVVSLKDWLRGVQKVQHVGYKKVREVAGAEEE